MILIEKSHRKFLLDNTKFIYAKLPERLNAFIIPKDLTPQQRQERQLKVERKAGRNGSNRNDRPGEAPSLSDPSVNDDQDSTKYGNR